MPSLLNKQDNEAIIARIARLTPDRGAAWGKMTGAQMLAHAQAPLRVAFGELKLKRGLVGMLFGPTAKRKLMGDAPWEHNLPTDKAFKVTADRDLTEEQAALTALVRRFLAPGAITVRTHPFFGPMTTEEWGVMMWKHIDHHLGQFGV